LECYAEATACPVSSTNDRLYTWRFPTDSRRAASPNLLAASSDSPNTQLAAAARSALPPIVPSPPPRVLSAADRAAVAWTVQARFGGHLTLNLTPDAGGVVQGSQGAASSAGSHSKVAAEDAYSGPLPTALSVDSMGTTLDTRAEPPRAVASEMVEAPFSDAHMLPLASDEATGAGTTAGICWWEPSVLASPTSSSCSSASLSLSSSSSSSASSAATLSSSGRLVFSSSLGSGDRLWLHTLAQGLGLGHTSEVRCHVCTANSVGRILVRWACAHNAFRLYLVFN
jgi:hypothetical protein